MRVYPLGQSAITALRSEERGKRVPQLQAAPPPVRYPSLEPIVRHFDEPAPRLRGCLQPASEAPKLLKKRLHSAGGTVACGNGGGIPMADVANKYPQNVVGKYFVDDQCIDCDLCRETAPANFTRNDDGGHSFVYKQPESPEEEALCIEAKEGCPVEAIGDDGE
jgi:ferredoxin